MIAMHYGQIPVVHHVGGLADTVQPYNDFYAKSEDGYGIVFSKPNSDAFLKAIDQALALYKTKARYNKMIKHNMLCDFSWKESAQHYVKQYEKIIQKRNCG